MVLGTISAKMSISRVIMAEMIPNQVLPKRMVACRPTPAYPGRTNRIGDGVQGKDSRQWLLGIGLIVQELVSQPVSLLLLHGYEGKRSRHQY